MGLWRDAVPVSEPSKDHATASSDALPSSCAISVMLIVPDAAVAVAWYKTALGATELWNLGGVAGLEAGGAPFFLHEINPGIRRRPARCGPESPAPGSRCSLTSRTHSSNVP